MPCEVTLESLPAGYAVTEGQKGQPVLVRLCAFLSSEDGDRLITCLEGLPSRLLSKAGIGIPPSMVDHLLGIIRPDKTATLYVNELSLSMKVQVKRSMKAGQPVFADDMADIESIDLGGVDVPPDTGVVFLFSVGWRQGLFYDLLPLAPPTRSPRDYDLRTRLGQLYRYLKSQHVYKIGQDEWGRLIETGWFPFVTLKTSTVQQIIARVRNAWNVDELVPDIADEVNALMPRLKERWASNSYFSDHYDVLEVSGE
jgi:hypothetical protein